MKRFRVHMESPYAGQTLTEDFEMQDDATEAEIEAEAREVFFNNFTYSVEELPEEETE